MKLTDFSKFDSNLKIVKNPDWPEEILAISSLESLQKNSAIFIRNAKFLNRFLPSLKKALDLQVGLVIDEKFYGLLNSQDKLSLESLPWIATTSNLALSLTVLSKPFYDLKMQGLNYQVDGRQLGTVDIHPTARISQNVFIGEHVKIGAYVEILPGSVIMPYVSIYEGTKIFSNVSLYPFTQIGKNCRIHSGVVIGSDGFGYTFHQGQHLKIWHMGGVIIESDVEIGSNSSVDMGTFSPTLIGSGTRIDNLVQVGHNSKIGRGCILCGQAGTAGSSVLEDFVVLGGRAAVGPEVHLGMGTQVAGGAKVTEGQWPAGSKLGGHPARDLKEWMRGLAYLRKVSLKENNE
jgi:UDP-3-O-[3-hydroxymyristoyl] glucosamine N-acyltransferase